MDPQTQYSSPTYFKKKKQESYGNILKTNYIPYLKFLDFQIFYISQIFKNIKWDQYLPENMKNMTWGEINKLKMKLMWVQNNWF